jgi:DNA primase
MFIDFKELKEKVDIGHVVDLLGLEMNRQGGVWRGRCPKCETGDDRTLVVTPGKQAFYCFHKNTGGDIIGLGSHILDYSPKDAAFHISTNLLIQDSTVPPKSQEGEEQGKRTLQPLGYLIYEHSDVQSIGFSSEKAEELGIGFAPKGMMRGRVVFPIWTGDTLAGYIGYKDGELKIPDNLKEV